MNESSVTPACVQITKYEIKVLTLSGIGMGVGVSLLGFAVYAAVTGILEKKDSSQKTK